MEDLRTPGPEQTEDSGPDKTPGFYEGQNPDGSSVGAVSSRSDNQHFGADNPPGFSDGQIPRRPPASVAMILAGFILFSMLGTIVGTALTFLLGKMYGLDAMAIASTIGPDATPDERGFVRWMLILSHLGTFVLPGLLTIWAFYRPGEKNWLFGGRGGPEHWLDYLKARNWPGWLPVVLGILLLAVSLPLVHYLYGVNKALPLPDWMRSMETQTNDAIKGILKMDGLGELLANLFVMAVIPAIGEELVFRGILQQQLMRKIASPLLAILVAGAIFSLIHMQFEGFLPRWLLGVALGWLFWRSQNFWVPVVAHFFNNGFQVVGQFFFANDLSTVDFEKDIEVPWFVALVSVFLIWAVARNFEQKT